MSTSTLRASTVGRARRRPKTFGEGRVCSSDGCTVQLSRYNRSDHCFSHAPARFPRLRGEFTEGYAARQQSCRRAARGSPRRLGAQWARGRCTTHRCGA